MSVFSHTLPKFGSIIALACLGILKPTPCFSEGAFAFGQWDGGAAWGTAINHSTQAEAQTEAMNNCNARGYNCIIRTTFTKTCFAVAVQDDGNNAAWQTDSDISRAQQAALRICARVGVLCTIKVSVCDDVSEYQQFLRYWEDCFAVPSTVSTPNAIATVAQNHVQTCNQALTYSALTDTDRARIIQQRDSLVSLWQKEQRITYEEFLRHWQECFAAVELSADAQNNIQACDQALSYTTDATDRSRLMQQRDSLVSLQQKQKNIAYQEFLRHWQECFATVELSADAQNHLQACDQALSYTTDATDRSRLMQQRGSLVSLQTQVRPQHADDNIDNQRSILRQLQLSLQDAISRLTDLTPRFTSDSVGIAAALLTVVLVATLFALYGRFGGGRLNGVRPSLAVRPAYAGISSYVGILEKLMKLIANAPTFAILYVLVMVPTYILPYFGSNSAFMNVTGKLGGIGFSPQFWYHLACLGVLCLLALARGIYIAKVWLVIFPIFALLFDMVPTLNLVPFVPTVMHLSTVIVGVSSRKFKDSTAL